MPEKTSGLSVKTAFHYFSTWVSNATGKPIAFIIALLIVIAWALSGRAFHYSEIWQMIINTGTTIITFLMIFVIQQSQNRDTAAIHLKLNELLAANKNTSNRLVASEDMTLEELEVIKKYYKKISDACENNESVFATHSLDEAEQNAKTKLAERKLKETITHQDNKNKDPKVS